MVYESQTAMDTADVQFSVVCRLKLGDRLELDCTFGLAIGSRLIMHGEVEDLAMLFCTVCGLPEGDGASGLVRGGQVHLRLHSRACSWW